MAPMLNAPANKPPVWTPLGVVKEYEGSGKVRWAPTHIEGERVYEVPWQIHPVFMAALLGYTDTDINVSASAVAAPTTSSGS
jgi:hypothetical protein